MKNQKNVQENKIVNKMNKQSKLKSNKIIYFILIIIDNLQ